MLYLPVTTACSLQQKVHNNDSQKSVAVMRLQTSRQNIPGQAFLCKAPLNTCSRGESSQKIKLSSSTLERSTSCSCCLLACQLPPSWAEQRPWALLQPLPWSCTCQAPGPVHKPLHFIKTNVLKKKKKRKTPSPVHKSKVDILFRSH